MVARPKKGNKVQKRAHSHKVIILKDRCKGCELCVIYCPTNTLEMSKNVNVKGNFIPEVVALEKCKGCKICFKMCPDFAIFVEDELKKRMK